jgi:hypothetical protein
VIRLQRDEGHGAVVIKGTATDVDTVHRYRVALADDDYHQALVAHDQDAAVAARGTLEIRGNFLWITELKWFAVQQQLLAE